MQHSTTLINQIGFDTIDEVIGDFKIVGSAVKYLADIAHLSKSYFKMDSDIVSGEVKREILFEGGISIYRIGMIPGTEIQGYDLERHGRIWAARNPEDRFYDSKGLRNLILEDGVGRMEAILEGYQIQEQHNEEIRDREKSAQWESGHSVGLWKEVRYRSGPC